MLMTVPPKTMELLVVSAANGAEVTTQVAVAGRAVFGEAAVREVGGGATCWRSLRCTMPKWLCLWIQIQERSVLREALSTPSSFHVGQ